MLAKRWVMSPLQLDFFDETSDEYEKINRRIDEIALSSDKVRKGIYARHGELAKKYLELHQRMETIERFICKS